MVLNEINDLNNVFNEWEKTEYSIEKKENNAINDNKNNDKNDIAKAIFTILYFTTLKYCYDKYKIYECDKYETQQFLIAHHYRFLFFASLKI